MRKLLSLWIVLAAIVSAGAPAAAQFMGPTGAGGCGNGASCAGGPPPGASYQYRTSNNFDGSGFVQNITATTGSGTRTVIIALTGQSTNTISSIVVNGQSLTQRCSSNTGETSALWDGVVTASDTGANNVVITWTVSAFF